MANVIKTHNLFPTAVQEFEYVAEQNLVDDDSDEPIKHPLIEEIFSGKKGSGYFKPSH